MAIARNQLAYAPGITRIEQARQLAQDHRTNDPDTTHIYFVEDVADREVRLLEVSTSVGNAGAVMPVRFTACPDQGLDYPTVIVLLSPEEKAQVDAGHLELPETWGVKSECRTSLRRD